MANAGCGAVASSCCRVMLTFRIETARSTGSWLKTGVRMQPSATRSIGTLCQNETWCRRWWNISRKGISTSAKSFSPSLSSILSKEQQNVKEAKSDREPKEKVGKESKDAKSTKETKKQAKEKSVTGITPGKGVISIKRKPREPKDNRELKETQEQKDLQKWRSMIEQKKLVICEKQVVVEYHRGLPRITLPLPSRSEKCMFTLKPISQTIGDFLEMLKIEDPAVIDASITTTNGVKMGATNRIEGLLMDDFNLIINDKVYPVSPPLHIEKPKESLQQLRDVQALIHQLYETFNAREYHVQLEREVMLHLEEVKLELEPLEQLRLELEEAAARRSHLASWGVLVLMSMQFGCLARLTWWEYSWDIMEPVTYFVTYATAMGCYIYFLLTRQEYMLPDVFSREHLIGLHKRAKKLGFDLDRYNMLKDEAHELETMLRLIRGPLHHHQSLVEQKRRERLEKTRSSSSSSSSSRSSSRSPSSSPERAIENKEDRGKKPPAVPSAVISN